MIANRKSPIILEYFLILDMSKHKKSTCTRVCCNSRFNDTETHRTRITVGGNRLHYSGDAVTQIARITTTKMHISSTL